MGDRRWRALREFGELETAIMEVMWAGDRPYVVREVRERLRYGRPVAYTTVMTVMNILHRKGVLHRDKLGRAWQYWPVEAREDHDARLMAEVLRSGGDENVTMRRFLERVSDDEMDSLCCALAAARSRRLAAS
jgi:predicted transcriptional regulator